MIGTLLMTGLLIFLLYYLWKPILFVIGIVAAMIAVGGLAWAALGIVVIGLGAMTL